MKNSSNVQEPIIVGLDIGTTKTVMIVGRRNEHSKIEVLAYGKSSSKGMIGAEVVNVNDIVSSIKSALKKCYESNIDFFVNRQTGEHIIEVSEVVVGIAGRHISCKQVHHATSRLSAEDIISFDEIEELRKQQFHSYVTPGDEIINVIPKYYQIDQKHRVIDPIGCIGKRIDAYYNIVIGNTEEIKKICKAVEMAGLKIAQIYLQPLASSMSILSDVYKQAGVAIVDIGGGTTDIAVFQNGALSYTSVINLAGNFITDTIYNDLQLFRNEEAEALKIEYGSCVPDLVRKEVRVSLLGESGMEPAQISIYQLSLNINHAVKEIISQIIANLTNNGIHTKTLRAGIFITGGGALLNHLIQLIAHETNLKAKVGYPSEHLAAGFVKGLEHPENATCYGLILYGFELFDKQQVNTYLKTLHTSTPSPSTSQATIHTDIQEQQPTNPEPVAEARQQDVPPTPPPSQGFQFPFTRYLNEMYKAIAQEFVDKDKQL